MDTPLLLLSREADPCYLTIVGGGGGSGIPPEREDDRWGLERPGELWFGDLN